MVLKYTPALKKGRNYYINIDGKELTTTKQKEVLKFAEQFYITQCINRADHKRIKEAIRYEEAIDDTVVVEQPVTPKQEGPVCQLCNAPTSSVVNINLKAVPVCDTCTLTVYLQQSKFMADNYSYMIDVLEAGCVTPQDLKELNKYVAIMRPDVQLAKGEGYFYIFSDWQPMSLKIASLYQSGIYVSRVNQLTKQQWIDEIDRLFNNPKNS